MDGRSPNASGQISTPGCVPVAGWMKAALQMPSGVLIETSLSTTGSAASAGTAPLAMPAATTVNATNSRRDRSPVAAVDVSVSCSSLMPRLLGLKMGGENILDAIATSKEVGMSDPEG